MTANTTTNKGIGTPHHEEKFGEQKPDVSAINPLCGEAGISGGIADLKSGNSICQESYHFSMRGSRFTSTTRKTSC